MQVQYNNIQKDAAARNLIVKNVTANVCRPIVNAALPANAWIVIIVFPTKNNKTCIIVVA